MHYTEINEVYISRAARAFGLAMIGVFVPIYLYNLGYGIMMIALFFVVANLCRLVTTPLAARLLTRIGAKHTIVLSTLWSVVYVLLLMWLGYANSTWLLLLTAVVFGIELGVFWVAHHFNLSYARSQGKASRQIGVIFILLSIAQALGPLIGGIVATQFDIMYAFVFAIGLLLMAGYVCLQTPDQRPDARFCLADALRGWRPMRRDILANAGNGLQTGASLYIWPLFIFLFLGTYQNVGLIVSLSLIVAIVAIHFIARWGDQGRNRQQIHIGSKGSSLVHASRPLAQTFGAALGINLIHEVAAYFYRIPFVSYYYEHASNAGNRLAYIAGMEMVHSIAAGVSWLLLLILGWLFPPQVALIGIFFVAALGVLLNTKIAPKAATSPMRQTA